MKTNIFKLSVFMLSLAIATAGCKKPIEVSNGNDDEDFCSHFNSNDFDKAIPFVDEFLSDFHGDKDDEQKLVVLIAWLKTKPCITDAVLLCQSCIETDPPTSQIVITFDENETSKKLVLNISMSNPLKVAGYREYEELKEKFCSNLNEEDIDKAITVINEFLSGFSDDDFDDEQPFQKLTTWLKSNPCIVDANLFCISCGDTMLYHPNPSLIAFSFGEKGNAKDIFLKVEARYDKKFKVVGYLDNPVLAFFRKYLYPIAANRSECFFVRWNDRYNENKFLIINSMDELKQNFSCSSFFLPAIDFDLYTLVIGQYIVGGSGYRFIEHQVAIGQETIELIFIVECPDASFPVLCPVYYWGLFPKIQNNKSINVNVIFQKGGILCR